MPIYEYKCVSCGYRFSRLVGVVAETAKLKCPLCGNENATPLISRFRSQKSREDVMEDMENRFSGVDMEDPKSVTKAMKEMGSALQDEEDFGENYDLMMDRAEKEVYDGAEKEN